MQPSLPRGSLVVVRPVDPADEGAGSVISYQLASGRDEVVTHRVVSQGLDADTTRSSGPVGTPTTPRTRPGCAPSSCVGRSGTPCRT